MAITRIADVIVPQIFNNYVITRTTELSALAQSGIISNSPELDSLATAGGKLINMPYWTDLTGEDEVLSDSGALTPANIVASQDVATLFMRGKAWSTNDLAKSLAGSDPMAAIGDLVAGYWARRRQALLLSMLKGVFASATMAGNILDVSALAGSLATITGNTFIDSLSKLGDAAGKITAVAMHSAVYASLKKQNLITTIKPSENTEIEFYMGKQIIIDDGCPVNAGVYDTFLFGEGAIGLGNGAPGTPTETDRDSLAGNDILINRSHFVLHPRGVKFTSTSVAGSSPTNLEVANSANWTRVYDNKAIKIILFRHKI